MKIIGFGKEKSIFWGYALSLLNVMVVYRAGGTTSVYPNFNYIPIAIVASTCGRRTGVIHALFTGILMGPLMPLHVSGAVMQPMASWMMRAGIYVTIAWIIGFFAELNEQRGRDMADMLSRDQVTGFLNVNALRSEKQISVMSTGFVAITVRDYEAVMGFFGLSFSEDLVKEYARVLGEAVDGMDGVSIYRNHGMEFVVRVESASDERMKAVCDRLESIHGSTIVIADVPLYIESRMGVSVAKDYITLEMGLRSALLALRKAVSSNHMMHKYDEKDEEAYNILTSTASRFSAALRDGHIKVAFQEIVSTSGGKSGYELLARWINGKEIIPPGKFIPVIERSDLINELTRLMIRTAADFIEERGSDLDFVSMNFSVNSLSMHNIMYMDEIVRERGIDPRLLVIEITEEVFAQTDEIASILRAASEKGYRIAVDDFGSGYSSYRYIDLFPIDIIKIDRDIVIHMDSSEKTRNIVRSIVHLSRENGMVTVAEGIETQNLADECKAYGFDFLQGFLYHRPEIIE